MIVAAFLSVCAVAAFAPLAAMSLVVEPRMRRPMDAHERNDQR